MNCWKCGQPTEHGAAECSDCELGLKPRANVEGILDDDDKIEVIEIDWDKVQTFADLKEVVMTLGWCDMVVKDSEEHKKLQRFLKEEKPS